MGHTSPPNFSRNTPLWDAGIVIFDLVQVEFIVSHIASIQARIQDFEMGVNFCNNVIEHYFNI